MIEKMIEELKNTTKRKEKIKILSEYFSLDQEIPKLLSRCYNPFEKFYVTTVKSNIVGTKNISETYKQLNTLLDYLTSRTITGNMAREAVLRYMNTLNKESQKIFINILNKDLKCGIGPESINAAYPGLIEQFSIQLANKYKPEKEYKVPFFYGSRKYDGIRCIYQEKREGIIFTREGNALVGFDNIIADLETLIDRMKLEPVFSDFEPNTFFVDGELYAEGMSFNDIQSIVLSTKNVDIKQKRTLKLKVFAIGPVHKTEDMIHFFESKKIFKGLYTLEPIEYFKVYNNRDEILGKTREFISEGYEGLMLRHPEIPYDWKRSDNLLKSKLNDSTVAELTIIGYEAGKKGTKFENTLGTFICVGTVTDPIFTDGKVMPGEYEVSCQVGSGFSEEERSEIWKDPEFYIGKELIVTYQCMSKNSATDQYSLRFAVKQKGFKLDRNQEW